MNFIFVEIQYAYAHQKHRPEQKFSAIGSSWFQYLDLKQVTAVKLRLNDVVEFPKKLKCFHF